MDYVDDYLSGRPRGRRLKRKGRRQIAAALERGIQPPAPFISAKGYRRKVLAFIRNLPPEKRTLAKAEYKAMRAKNCIVMPRVAM